jgi:transposase-like protein
MDESKMLVKVSAGRRHTGAAERARILARWATSGASAKEFAQQTGLSPEMLYRWRRINGSHLAASPTMVEVPTPAFGLSAAEVVTPCGALRFSGHGSPTWAAQLLRELARC